MFNPVKLQVPDPALVNVPVVVPMIESIEPPAAPPKVKPNVAPVIVLVLVNAILPASPTILVALPKAMRPAYVDGLALELISAPPSEIPVPKSVSKPVLVMVVPFKSNTAPDET